MTKKLKVCLIVNYIILCFLLLLNIFLLYLNLNETKTDLIFENNISKVVEIKSSSDGEIWNYATGCFINNKGMILTNKHVVYDSAILSHFGYIKVRIATSDEFIDAKIISISDEDDLAILQINDFSSKYFEIAKNVMNGETIYTIGNPNGFGLSFISGVISNNKRAVIYNNQTINALQTSFVINEGNSGGPVFNRDGKLLGLVSFRLKDKNNEIIQGVSFAIPVDTIREFINDI